MFEITLYSKIVFLVAFTIFTFSLIIILGSKKYTSRTFAFWILSIMTWVILRGLFHGAEDEAVATILNKCSFAIGSIIATGCFYFSLTFPENKRPSWKITLFILLSLIALIPVYFVDHLFLGKAQPVGGIQRWGWEQGPLLFIYDIILYPGYWALGLGNLFRKTRKCTGQLHKNLMFMSYGLLVGIAPITITTVILPRCFNYFSLDWTGPLTIIGCVSIIGYSIIKHNQMNVRTVFTELLVLAAIFILFLGIFV